MELMYTSYMQFVKDFQIQILFLKYQINTLDLIYLLISINFSFRFWLIASRNSSVYK